MFQNLNYVVSFSLWAAVRTCKWSISTPDPWNELSPARSTTEYSQKLAELVLPCNHLCKSHLPCHGYDIYWDCPDPGIGARAPDIGGNLYPHWYPTIFFFRNLNEFSFNLTVKINNNVLNI